MPVGLVDLLRKATTLAASDAPPGIEVTLVSTARRLTVAALGGVRLRCDAVLRDVAGSGLVLVPALDPDVLEHLALNGDVVPWLRAMYDVRADVASACTGSLLLAEAGLLDRKGATTHWAFQDAFRQRYPQVRLKPEAVVVDQGRVVPSGGATSFLNLALYLVERVLGAEVARAAARMFRVDVDKAPQSAQQCSQRSRRTVTRASCAPRASSRASCPAP